MSTFTNPADSTNKVQQRAVYRQTQPTLTAYSWGLAAVLMFSGGLVATRLAVLEMPPLFVGAGRAALAGVFSLLLLALTRQKLPPRRSWPALLVVAFGAVFAYPVFSAIALQQTSASHATVVSAIMPLFTAIFGVLLTREFPRIGFWCCAFLCAAIVLGYQFQMAGQAGEIGGAAAWQADLWMLLGCLCCGLAYAQGAVLAKTLGSWQVICWALVLSLPLMLAISAFELPQVLTANVSALAWGGLLYLSVFSMFLGFFAWYHALAIGGVAQISQLQQLSPFLSLAIAATLLAEPVSLSQFLVAALVVILIVAGRKLG